MTALVSTVRRHVDPMGVTLWIMFLVAMRFDQPLMLAAWLGGVWAAGRDSGATP